MMRWAIGFAALSMILYAQYASLTAQQDRQRLMDLLHIASLRSGANGSNPQAPNYANYDESKANPYPNVPDPLVMKDGRKVTTAAMWSQRRPEIVEDFDREIYGRMPKQTPKVAWEVTSTARDKIGDVPVITKRLEGHVDNSSYPAITVTIQLTLSTPAEAPGPVPVILELSFTGLAGRGGPGPAPAGPTSQQQVLAKGWGYATLAPTSVQADNGGGLTQGIIGLVNHGQPRQPIGARCARGHGARAARSIISRLIPPSTPGASASKDTRAMVKRRLWRWRTIPGSPSPSSARRERAG